MSGSASRWHLLTVFALVAACWGLSRTLGQPFDQGWLGHNGARYAQIARNYDRDGFLAHGGAPSRRAGSDVQASPDVYAHHPPGLAALIGVVFRLAGPSEDAARAVPIAATVLLLAAFGLLVKRVVGARVAALSVALAAAQPMVNVYGAHIDVQGAPVLALSVACLIAYRHWLTGGSVAWLALLSAGASSFDWYGLYTPVCCAVHAAATGARGRGAAGGLIVFTLALFAGWLAWLSSLPGVPEGQVAGAAGVRGWGALLGGGEAVGPALDAWWRATQALMPAWPLLLLVTLLVACGWRAPGAAGAVLGARGLLFLLLAPPLIHGVLFPAGMLQHGYWLFGLPLGLAFGTALALEALKAVPALLVVAAAFVAGAAASEEILAERDPLPVLLGAELAARTAPADLVLTNYDCNPFAGEGPGYVLLRPGMTWAADRAIRGSIGDAASLERALRLRPDARWFLETPWPRPVEDALAARLADLADGPPQPVSGDPPVRLWSLGPRAP